MVNINDFKRELSKLAGIDFFNPKFRDVFKKYFDDEDSATAEIDRAEELGIIDEAEANDMREEVDVADDIQDAVTTDTVDDIQDEVEDKIDDKVAEEVAEDKAEEVAQDVADEVADDTTTEVETEVEDNGDTVEVEKEVKGDGSTSEELLDAKIELGLVRAGVREDKIRPAMIIAKEEIKSINDLDKIKEIVKQFPEWMQTKDKPAVRGFGMEVDESGDGLTEEEKRFKELYGQDPRD